MTTAQSRKGVLRREKRWERPVSSKAIHAVRLKNLQDIIEAKFEGNAAACAKAIDRSHTFLWQLTNARRGIGEDTARHIEESLGLPLMSLDAGGAIKPTKTLRAVLSNGESCAWHMVPDVELSLGLKKKTGVVRPCPIAEGGVNKVNIKVPSDSMEPLLVKGDLATVDKDQTEVLDGKVYVLQVRGMKEPIIRMARARDGGTFEFVALKSGHEVVHEHQVQRVEGRVFYSGHDL